MSETNAIPFVLSHEDLDPQHVEALLGHSVVAISDVGVLEISGPAAIDCLQGLVTADLKGPGDGSFIYGAMLTPKGMIVTDMWIARQGASVWLTVPNHGMDPLLESFKKYLPPRLATVNNHTDDYVTLRVAGPHSPQAGKSAGIDLPKPGNTTSSITGGSEGTVARPPGGAPFSFQIQAPRSSAELFLNKLESAGSTRTPENVLQLCRTLNGWPALGAEVGEKTLPQEVRFDDHNGISYTKGCYTGQETIARLHFRGHANRELTGLRWDVDPADPENDAILQDGKRVGNVTSMVWVEPFSSWIGLGLLHRKANPSETLIAGGAETTVVPLPMQFGS
jgi:folate-binding protein YgfZ